MTGTTPLALWLSNLFSSVNNFVLCVDVRKNAFLTC